MKKNEYHLTFRVSPEEYKRLTEQAIEEGIRVNLLAREIVTKRYPPYKLLFQQFNELAQKMEALIQSKNRMSKGIEESILKAIESCVITEELTRESLGVEKYEKIRIRKDERMIKIKGGK